MHGSISLIVQKFIETNFGVDTWLQILEQAGLPGLRFSPLQHYPDEAINQIVQATCEHLEIEQDVALRTVGRFAAKDLIRLGRKMLHPEWRTFEVLSNLETLIHRTVRMGDPDAEPADIQCHQISDSQMQVIYSSRRGLCALASGILSGMGDVFSQKLDVIEDACCKRGDPFCAFTVCLLEDASEKSAVPVTFPMRSFAVDTDRGSARTSADAAGGQKSGSESSFTDNPTVLAGSDSGENGGRLSSREDWLHLLPSQVGRYRVLDSIGAGGMGVVFQGVDEELGRSVAIKTLRRREVSTTDLRLFLSEARQLARLNHPRVVKIFDVGRIGSRPFFVMEWLQGITLHERLTNGLRLPFDMAARLFIQILDALEAVHRIGIVHRDVKPGNIMITPGGTSCTLLDFGLAATSRMQGSGISGTLGYLAPERLQGMPGDFRGDFFSLGVLSLELFAGIPAGQLPGLNLRNGDHSKHLNTIDEWNVLNENMKELIEGLLQTDPDARQCDGDRIRSVLRGLLHEF